MSSYINAWACATHAERVDMHRQEADRQHAAIVEAERRRASCLEFDDKDGARLATKHRRAHYLAWKAHTEAISIEMACAAVAGPSD